MTNQERQQKISQHLSMPKPYSEQLSDKLTDIQMLTMDIQELEENPATRARCFAELAAMFAGMAARELGGS